MPRKICRPTQSIFVQRFAFSRETRRAANDHPLNMKPERIRQTGDPKIDPKSRVLLNRESVQP